MFVRVEIFSKIRKVTVLSLDNQGLAANNFDHLL